MSQLKRVGALVMLTTRGLVSYQADFIIGTLAILLFHFANLAAIYLLFDYAGTVRGWTPSQAVFLAAVSNLRFALGGAFFWGLNELPRLIRNSKLDRILVYPVSPWLTLLCQGKDPAGLVDLGFVIMAVIWSGHAFLWVNPAALLGFLTLLVFGLAATFGFTLLTVSPSFWATGGNLFPQAFRLLWEFQPYPANLFPMSVRFALTWVVPITVAVSIPADVLLGRLSFLKAVETVALVSAVDVLAGMALFSTGLRKYQSAGH